MWRRPWVRREGGAPEAVSLGHHGRPGGEERIKTSRKGAEWETPAQLTSMHRNTVHISRFLLTHPNGDI